MPQGIRSLVAVLAGFVVMMVVVVALTLVCMKAMHLHSGHPTPAYLALNMVYSVGAAVLGGWVCGRVARWKPVQHGLALGVAMLLMGMVSLLHPGTGQAFWYLLFLTVLPPLAAVGGSAMVRPRGSL